MLEQRLLAHNDQHATANRRRFQESGVRVVNLLSSPGSGKTALLEALAAAALRGPGGGRPLRQAALVGDLATDNDARRLRAAGLPALQINTGQGCHLEAAQVGRALDRLEAEHIPLAELDLLWIENVGNLVCPAAYDLGESLRLVLVSTTEGEDKPLKYAPMFHGADLVLISKSDLAAVVGFDRAAAQAAITRVAPRARLLEVSARTGQGLAALAELLLAAPATTPAGR
jgi:hydrogenase nickel incorporation protein HypB